MSEPEAKPLSLVLGEVMGSDLQREAERVDRDRRERERRRAEFEAATKAERTYSGSQLVAALVGEDIPDGFRIRPKESTDATPPPVPRSSSKIPPPPTRK